MPLSRFTALYGQIATLEAQEDLRAVMVAVHGAHPGERGRALLRFSEQLRGRSGEPTRATPAIAAELLTQGLAHPAAPGALQEARRKAQEADARLRQQHASDQATDPPN